LIGSCIVILITGSSDIAKPFCTTAYFIDNYAMFTCGNGQKASMVSAFYHAASESAGRSSATQQQPAASSKPSSGPTETSHAAPGGSSTPIGPIIGGVVGGVGILVLALVLIWRTKRKDKTAAKASSSSDSVLEMTKPPTAQNQASELWPDSKTHHLYSELEVRPTELPLAEAHYAHETGTVSADPRKLGRSELMGSGPRVYGELDGSNR
jgi:hypothetical protein